MRKAFAVWGLLAAFALACSDDDGEAAPGDGGGLDGSSEAGLPTGGSGGTGGSTTSSTGGTGGVTSTPPLMCGETTCPPPPGQDLVDALASFGFPVPGLFAACCTEDEVCGLNVTSMDDGGFSSTDCVPRPESDPRCPDRNLLGVMQPGCCIEETGMCGVDTAQIGGDCTDYSEGLAGALLGFMAVPCSDEDGGIALDAGP